MATDDPTHREPPHDQTVRVGALLRRKRTDIGWSQRYAAARLGLSLDVLKAIERSEPIHKSQYTRIVRIYNRTMFKLTSGMARTTPPGRFQ